jgi:type I restriction enzyme S subunit
LRLLTSGEWNKDPVLIAARRLVFSALGEEFEPVLLGDVATFLNGTSYDKAHVHAAGALPVIRISNISDPSSQYVRTDEVLPARFLVAAGDLLVSWSASFKSIIWPGPAGVLNQHIFKVTEKDGFDRHFIRHAIEASFEKMQEGVVGIGMMHLRRDAFLSHPIPSIPIALQRHVAGYLDAVEKRERRPEDASHECLARAMRDVERIEAIAGKVEEAKRLRGEADIESAVLRERAAAAIYDREVESAPLRTLAEIVAVRGGGTPSKSNPFYWEGQIPWVSPKDMKVREIRDSIDHISDAATNETAAKLVKPGAVLVVVRGMILAHTVPSAVLRVPAAINQDMKALIPGPDLLPEYLSGLFWAYNKRFLGLVEKSTHDTRKLQTARLLDTKIPIPPIDQQRRIVDDLANLEVKVSELAKHQLSSAVAIDAVMAAVLDRAFRGAL